MAALLRHVWLAQVHRWGRPAASPPTAAGAAVGALTLCQGRGQLVQVVPLRGLRQSPPESENYSLHCQGAFAFPVEGIFFRLLC